MPALNSYDYAIIRVVPRVERGEFLNAGIVLFCRTRRFLQARIALNHARLAALAPRLEVGDVEQALATYPAVCAGGKAAGALGALPQTERFHWLVAPRSTVIQTSPVHCGVCADLEHELNRMMERFVL
ncbi:MAG TPA: DUF3037 domain-containing protein [Roseiflexaceae bacterium]|nr:DUF3037 domain-containing protein [Roseiflexaceae bacterium]